MPKTISLGVSVRARLGSARLDPAGGNAAVVVRVKVKPLAIIEHETPPCTCSLILSAFVISLFVLCDHVS